MLFNGEYLNGLKWNGNIYDNKGNIILELKNGNGKGKTNDRRNKFQFEGQFLNGKRHGKGKEYSNNQLIFEGEFLNGERNGKGKVYEYHSGYGYYNKMNLEFEGEYINGKRNGIGKEYTRYGILIYEGEYINDEKWNGRIYKDPYEFCIE